MWLIYSWVRVPFLAPNNKMVAFTTPKHRYYTNPYYHSRKELTMTHTNFKKIQGIPIREGSEKVFIKSKGKIFLIDTEQETKPDIKKRLTKKE